MADELREFCELRSRQYSERSDIGRLARECLRLMDQQALTAKPAPQEAELRRLVIDWIYGQGDPGPRMDRVDEAHVKSAMNHFRPLLRVRADAELRSAARQFMGSGGMPDRCTTERRELENRIVDLLRGRADDGEAVDEAFIKGHWVGTPATGEGPRWYWISVRVFIAVDECGFWYAATPDGDPECWHPICTLMTRGDVRRLCAALGVPLNESTNAGTPTAS